MIRQLLLIVIWGWAGLCFSPPAMAEELIAPTRTLEGATRCNGQLTVVSEPPGLEVFLDGVAIGKTPAWQQEVTCGLHNLRVKDSETQINIEAAQTLGISLHKDSFILLPQKEETAEKGPAKKEKEETESAVPPNAPPVEEKKGLSGWDLFINRSQPFFY